MKYKVLTKIISFFLAIFFVFSTGAVFVSATETVVPEFEDIENSDVISDLKRMGIDITKYQKDLEADHCRMLYFLEYGYDYYASDADYGLYVYVWNPTGKVINTTTGMNSIELQISPTANVDRDGLGFLKYKLELCNYSTLQGYEHVFYKFKVADASGFLKNLNRDLRTYDISGVEIQHSGNVKPIDYAVGGVYSFDGYMPYHSATKAVKNTLHLSAVDRLIIELELNPVSWKTQTSDKGVGYQYEMFSVYFSVPNDIIRDYGNPENEEHKGLVAIDGQYSKHRINGLVTNDTGLYTVVDDYIGIPVGTGAGIPFAFYTDREDDEKLGYADIYIKDPYNINFDRFNWFVWNDEIDSVRNDIVINNLSSIVSYEDDFLTEISQEELSIQLNSLWSNSGVICLCDICNSLDEYGPFVDSDCGDNLYYTVNAGDDLTDQIATYASKNKKTFLGWLNGTNKLVIEDEVYDNAMSIQAIDLFDLYVTGVEDILKTDSVIGEEYFMSEADVNSFVSFVTSESAKLKTTYLMRFAVEDYYCREATVICDETTYDDGEYYFEKTIFQDIDIFTFTFENEYEQRVIIPVVASPVDNVGTITPTEPDNFFESIFGGGDKDDGGLSEIAKLLVIIAGILILAIIVFAISKLFGLPATWLFTNVAKAIVWFLSLPFKLLSWIFSSIKTLGGQPLKSSKNEKQKDKDNEKKE